MHYLYVICVSKDSEDQPDVLKIGITQSPHKRINGVRRDFKYLSDADPNLGFYALFEIPAELEIARAIEAAVLRLVPGRIHARKEAFLCEKDVAVETIRRFLPEAVMHHASSGWSNETSEWSPTEFVRTIVDEQLQAARKDKRINFCISANDLHRLKMFGINNRWTLQQLVENSINLFLSNAGVEPIGQYQNANVIFKHSGSTEPD